MDLKEFDDLINLGRVTRSLKLGSHEIVMGTLDSKEYAAAMTRIPAGASDGDKFEMLQREIVAAAIKTIDGKTLPQQDKVGIVTASQLGLSNMLYVEYLSLVEEQNLALEQAKKNSSAALMQ